MRHVQLKHIGSTAVQCSWCTCATDVGNTVAGWASSRQQLKVDVLAVNVSRGTGGILTVHCCWTVSHVTYSQCQLLARSATNIILLSHHVAHSSGPTESRTMVGAETSYIEHGLATSNGTVMSEGVIQQRVWQQPTEFLQREICQLCFSAAAVSMSVVIIANCCYSFTYINPRQLSAICASYILQLWSLPHTLNSLN